MTETRSKATEEHVKKLDNQLQVYMAETTKKFDSIDSKIDDLGKKMDLLMSKLFPTQDGVAFSWARFTAEACIRSIDCRCCSCVDDCSRINEVKGCIHDFDCNCNSCLDDCSRKRKQEISVVDITENTVQKVLDKCPQRDENGLEATFTSQVNSMLGPCEYDIKTIIDSNVNVEVLSKSFALLQIRRVAEMKDNVAARMGEMEGNPSVYLLNDELSLPMISKLLLVCGQITRNVLLRKNWKDLGVEQECLSRVKIVNTFSKVHGQIFIPEINWMLKLLYWALKFGFFPYDTDKQNDTTSIVFGHGMLVFDWGNQLKEFLDEVRGAASDSFLLFMYSLDYAKTELANDGTVANKWMVRQFDGSLGIYRKIIKFVVGIIWVDPMDNKLVATYFPGVLKSKIRCNLLWEEWFKLKQIHLLQFIFTFSCKMPAITWEINARLRLNLSCWSMNYEQSMISLDLLLILMFILKNLNMTLVIGNLEPFGSEIYVHTPAGDIIVKLFIFWALLSSADGLLKIRILVSSPFYFLLNIYKLVTPSSSIDCCGSTFERTLGEGENIVNSSLSCEGFNHTCAAMKTLGLPEKIESESQQGTVESSRDMFPESEKFRDCQLVQINATIVIFQVSVVDIVDVEISTVRFLQACSLQGYFYLTAIIKKLGSNIAWIWTSLTNKGPSKRSFERKHVLASDLLAAISNVHHQRLTAQIHCAIKALGFRDIREVNLERDVVNEECSLDFSNIQTNMIGSAKRVSDSLEYTDVLHGSEDKWLMEIGAIQIWISSIKQFILFQYCHWHWFFSGCSILPATKNYTYYTN